MSGDQLASVVGVAMAMMLVASGLIARRLPMRRMLALALMWAGIFLFAYLIARALA